ncbi:MAG: hypothetical protein K2K60_02815 [Clostridia bacterium]|nr:hypothetical protein [Clostridia bacterium]
MKKAIFLIAALLAVGTIGLAGCDRDHPGSGAGTDDLEPHAIVTEDTDGEDTENGEDKDELKPPHCEERMPHKHRPGDRRPQPRPMPRPERDQKIKR